MADGFLQRKMPARNSWVYERCTRTHRRTVTLAELVAYLLQNFVGEGDRGKRVRIRMHGLLLSQLSQDPEIHGSQAKNSAALTPQRARTCCEIAI